MNLKLLFSLLLTLSFLISNFTNLHAQVSTPLEIGDGKNTCLDPFIIPVPEKSSEPSNWSLFGGDLSCISSTLAPKQIVNSSVDVRTPADEIYDRLEWPDPRINFLPGGVSTPAGDLTGNGYTDLIRSYLYTIDERPDAPEVITGKTLIFEGGNPAQTEPDFFLYDYLEPVGDIDGSGKTNLIAFSDPIKIYEFDGSEFTEISFADRSALNFMRSHNSVIISDLDGDGYDDWVSRNSGIYFGADQYSSFELKEYDFSEILGGQISGFSFQNVIMVDSVKYLISVFTAPNTGNQTREPGSYMGVFELAENRDLELVQEIKFSSSTRLINANFFTAIIPGDENPSFIYHSSQESWQSDNPSGYQTFRIPPSENPDQLFENERIPFYPTRTWSAGDLFGDGSTDFIVRNDDNIFHHSEFDEIDNELKIGNKLPFQDNGNPLFVPVNNAAESDRIAGFGDQSGNGRDDFYMSVSNIAPIEADEQAAFGQLRVFVDESGQYSYEPVVYPLKDYQRTIIDNIFMVGDVTGNGVEDFIIYYTQTQNFRPEIVLHEGGSNWKEPYYTWNLDKDRVLDDLTAGNITSSNRRDIIILTRIDNPADGIPQSMIEIYETESSDPYFVIDIDNYLTEKTGLSEQLNRFGMVEIVGDVNNSGFDDLLISTPTIRIPPGLYFGGEQLSEDGPDLFLDFEDGYLASNDFRGNFIGMSLKGLGDISGNGIDDFAIADIEMSFFDSAIEFGNSSVGAVHVYYGRDEATPEFSVPDLTLRSDTTALRDGDNFFRFGFSEIAIGNFRSRDYKDIVVKSAAHLNNNSREGVPGVHIFHQEVTDGQPQQRLPLHTDLLATQIADFDSPFLPQMSGMRMAGIPDINKNGYDELLLVSTGAPFTNAVLHLGGEGEISEIPDVHFLLPDDHFPAAASVQIGFNQPRAPVGDVTGDGIVNLLMGQISGVFRDNPIYMFEIDAVAVSAEQVSQTPLDFSLNQNYPNPFNPVTVISYQLPKAGDVSLQIFDILGRRVAELVNRNQEPGFYQVEFDASELSSGVYLYRLQTNENVQTRQMVLVK